MTGPVGPAWLGAAGSPGRASTVRVLAAILRAAGRDPAEVDVDALDEAVAVRLRAVTVTLGVPAPGGIGVVEDLLVDRTFVADPLTEAVELATLADVRPTTVLDVEVALAAAALARAHDVPAGAVAEGLRAARHAPDLPDDGADPGDTGPMEHVDGDEPARRRR